MTKSSLTFFNVLRLETPQTSRAGHRIAACVLVVLFACGFAIRSFGGAYYVHPQRGDDKNAGTSEQTPWRTLQRANQARLKPGDSLLLAGGQKFEGHISYAGLDGNVASPIVLGSYVCPDISEEKRAIIDARGYPAGVLIRNSQHVVVRDLLITADAGGMNLPTAKKAAMRCGILIEADQAGTYQGFSVSNVVVKDVFFEPAGFVRTPDEVRTANGTQSYGWGIRFLASSPLAVMRDITLTDCQIENIEHTGMKLTASAGGLKNVNVKRIRIVRTGGPGVQMSGVQGGHFSELAVDGSGSADDSRKWGRGSGLWTWGSSDVVIERSRFENANGPGDSAGVHIDYHCRNIIVQHNFSANNAGGFCEILGNNHNCAYRYNISVNDGHRVKGRNGAFQEGKIFWLSGYVGKGEKTGPFNTYFYNNTIYVSEDIVTKISVAPTAQGVMIANNIFYFKGSSRSVLGDQNRPDLGHAVSMTNIVFRNNLYLRPDNWPADSLIQDEASIVGEPDFSNPNGRSAEDYIPRNASLVFRKGISISRIPQDEVGLTIGLDVERDILGNKINGVTDIGAIKIKNMKLQHASQ